MKCNWGTEGCVRSHPDDGAMCFTPRKPEPKKPRALDTYVEAIIDATIAYDASGDHQHAGSPVPGDCIRCNVVASLHPYAIRRIEEARASRKSQHESRPHPFTSGPGLACNVCGQPEPDHAS